MALVAIAQKDVTTSPAQAVATNRFLDRGLIIKAHTANNANVYVGTDNTVSNTTGFELAAGDSLEIAINNNGRQNQSTMTKLNGIWLTTSLNTQRVSLFSQ